MILFFAEDSLQGIGRIQKFLNEYFKIKNVDELKYFLGLRIAKSKKGIHIYQRKYALDILEETRMLGSKPCFTPLMSNTKLIFETRDKLQNLNPYRRLIGKLICLTN